MSHYLKIGLISLLMLAFTQALGFRITVVNDSDTSIRTKCLFFLEDPKVKILRGGQQGDFRMMFGNWGAHYSCYVRFGSKVNCHEIVFKIHSALDPKTKKAVPTAHAVKVTIMGKLKTGKPPKYKVEGALQKGREDLPVPRITDPWIISGDQYCI